LYITDFDEKPTTGSFSQRLARAGYKSYFLIPIYDKDSLIGSFNIGSLEQDPFGAGTRSMLAKVSELIGGTLKASEHFATLNKVTEDYQDAQNHFLLTEKYRNFIDITRGILHAFNNHLALIMGRAQLLRQFSGEIIDKERANKGLDIILRASTDAAEQIAKLQSYARINADDDTDIIQIQGLVEEIVQLSMPRWKAMGHGSIEFKLNLDSQAQFIGSRKKIKEALINILMNAVEASEETGGKIRVSAEQLSDKALITIRDQGVGIPRDQIPRLFIPFYSTKENGTGLGLAVAYRIEREHAGRIEVSSTPGKGTTVEITLPSRRTLRNSAEYKDSSRKIERAVVVQSSPINRRFLTMMLEQCDLQIHSGGMAGNIDKLYQDFEPDILIVDDGIVDTDPIEFLIEQKKNKTQLLIGLICSHLDSTEQKRLEGLGIDLFINKPYEQSQIRNIIEGLRGEFAPAENPSES